MSKQFCTRILFLWTDNWCQLWIAHSSGRFAEKDIFFHKLKIVQTLLTKWTAFSPYSDRKENPMKLSCPSVKYLLSKELSILCNSFTYSYFIHMWGGFAVKHAEYFAGNDIGFHLFLAQILHTCNIVLFMFSKII